MKPLITGTSEWAREGVVNCRKMTGRSTVDSPEVEGFQVGCQGSKSGQDLR